MSAEPEKNNASVAGKIVDVPASSFGEVVVAMIVSPFGSLAEE